MELFVIWFMALVATGEEIKATQADLAAAEDRIVVLEEQVDELDTRTVKIAAAHTAHVAAQKLEDEERDRNLQLIADRIDRIRQIIAESQKE